MKKLILLLVLQSFFVQMMDAQCPPPQFPPDPPGLDCQASLPLCQDIDGYCNTLPMINNQQNFPDCQGNVLNNPSWFSFVAATSGTLSIDVIPSNCLNLNGQEGMQGAMYEGACGGSAIATQCNCTTGLFNLSGPVVAGQSYFIVLDGCAGDVCDYEIDVTAGSTAPGPPPTEIPFGPEEVCPGQLVTYGINLNNADNYEWTISDPSVAMFNTPPLWVGANIDVDIIAEGTFEICVQGSNVCGQQSGIGCLTVNSEFAPDVNDVAEGCVGDLVYCILAPNAPPQIVEPTPFQETFIETDPNGCNYQVICEINPIILAPVDLGQVELCGPGSYEVCDGIERFQTGIYVEECQDPVTGCFQTTTIDLAIFEPEANISQPVPPLECDPNSTVMLNGIGSTQFSPAPGATTTLIWTGPGIVGSNSDPTIIVNEPGEYCLTVTFSRNGTTCTDQECVMVTRDADVPNPPTITGEDMPCEGVVYSYDATAAGTPAPTSFNWTTPNGEAITVVDINTIEIDWTGSNGGQLCVVATNDCGDSDPATCMTIVVGEAPIVPVVDGPDEVCAVNQTETFTITNPQANVTYNWTVPPGASFNGSGTSITVNFSGATVGAGQVCATATNDCSTSAAGCADFQILALPPTPAMSGPDNVCSNGTGYTYTVSNGSAGGIYNWTVPTGATIVGTGASIQVDYNGAQSGQVCVTITNECGNSQPTCVNVTVIQAPTATISGMGELCEGTQEDIDLTITVTGTAPWDVTYTVNSGNPTVISIPSSPYTLTVNQPGVYELTNLSSNTGGCVGSVNGSATIIENPLPTATLSGTDGICENSGELGELNIDLTGEAPWTIGWESNGTGQANVVANVTPFTLNVSESQAGTIMLTSVVDGNDCTGTVSGSGTVDLIQAPTVANVTRECDPTNTTYTVTIVIQGGDPTSYSVSPANGNLAGNTFVSNPIFSGIGYSFEVSDANDCNPVTVEGSFECDCESMVGDMDQTAIETCGDGPIDGTYDPANENLDADDVLWFMLHSGNGTAVVAPVVGEYTSPTNISFDPATMTYGTTYYLSAVVGNNDGTGAIDLNDDCLAVSFGTPVTFYRIPEATLSGSDAVCEGENDTLTVNFTGTAPWSISYDDGSGTIIDVSGINTNPYDLVVTPTMAGANTVCLTDMSDGNCPGNAMGCADIQVNTGVVIDDWGVECNATATGFTVTITISGGDPTSYVVTGLTGTLAGNIFTSDEVQIPPGTTVGFSATVSDGNDCDPQTVSQTQVVCNCTSDAGIMTDVAETACGDGPITVADASMSELDGDDVQVYYLHEGSGNTLTNVINTNTQPTFSFDGGTMAYGTTYYVSSVVGNTDGAGGVDPLDPCISISIGTPIIFYEIPTATISGGMEICPGEMGELMIDLTGAAPWSVTINGDVYDNISGSPFILQVTPDMTTNYDLTAVTDNNCDNIASGQETITVHDPPTVALDSEECNNTGTGYIVCFTISGGDLSGYSVTPNTGTLTGNQFCSDLIPDGDGYSYSITDGHGCPEVVIANPSFDCSCPTLAGDLEATPLTVCQNQMTDPTAIVYNDANEFLDPDDVLCYGLYNGTVNLATNPDEPVFGFNPGNMVLGDTYQICPLAGNDDGTGCVDFSDPCFNIGGCIEVTFSALPTATLSGTVDVCQGFDPELSIDLTGTGPWTITYQNSAMDVFTETATSSPYTLEVIPDISTIISLTDIVDANGCANTISGNSATVNVNEAPTIVGNIVDIECNALETEFTVSFTVTGGDPTSYTVDQPGTFAGNVFTSDPIPTMSNYTFLLDDANGCGPTVIDGAYACDCLTQVGIMSGGPLTLCDGESTDASIYDDATEIIAPSEIRLFVLLSFNSPSFNPINVVEVNPNEPVFSFNPATMNYGSTYYIAAVAGADDGTGMVDPDGFCVDMSAFVEVEFYALPTVTVDAPDAICVGDMAQITFNVTGVPPFTVNYLVNSIPGAPINLPIAGTQTIDIPIPLTSTITLVSIDDLNCSNTASQSVTVTVNPMVEAGVTVSQLSYCEGVNQPIQLSDQLSGSQPGGEWTTQTGQIIQNGMLNVGTLPLGMNTLTYTVMGMAPCPDDQAELEIEIIETPVADAGPDQMLNCDITDVDLNIGNTTPGALIVWSGPGIIVPTDPEPNVINPGIYTLTATIGQCTDSDEMEVTLNVSTPDPEYTVNHVSCFGESDGFIIIESVSGGVPPYLFSLDGGPFLAQQSFLNLAPGDHVLVIEDEAGCSTSEEFMVDEPVEVTLDFIVVDSVVNKDYVINLGDSVTITANPTPGPGTIDTFIWSPAGVDSNCVGCPSITVAPTQQTAYSLIVDENGCRAEELITIFISKERPVFVPNAFSPNDDKINDILHIYGGESLAKVRSFLIFNRWGELVHEGYDFEPAPRDFNQTLGWDGKHRGEFLNPGVYIWQAEIEFTDGSIDMYTGDITLIRNN